MTAGEPPKRPVIVIVGATGTGKSDLAIQLALRYNGEVINADSMQLYQGLPIITNKINSAEQKGIPHHLLSCVDLKQPAWTVGQFTTKALKHIESIHARGKLPIIAGGTHYYIQALLFKDSLASSEEVANGDFMTPKQMSRKWPVMKEDTSVILDELRRVDPIMADRWHPNDRRKIQRSLEIFLRTGKTASDTYTEQAAAERGSRASADGTDGDEPNGAIRFPTLIFWTHADREALYERLNKRVGMMRYCGLLDEVTAMRAVANKHAGLLDQTAGIWVSIGYKEFARYLDLREQGLTSTALEMHEDEGVEKMKARTRQYARRQVQWIRIKLINALRRHDASGCLFLLDGTQPERWAANVEQPAYEVADAFLKGVALPDPKSLSPPAEELLVPRRDHDMSYRPDLWARRVCDVCNVVNVTEDGWDKHVNSKGHRFKIRRLEQDTNGQMAPEGGRSASVR